jgi:hypothetical protein
MMNVLMVGLDTVVNLPGVNTDKTEAAVASKNFNAKNYDLILFNHGLRGKDGDVMEKAFFTQNIGIEFLYVSAQSAVDDMKIYFGI